MEKNELERNKFVLKYFYMIYGMTDQEFVDFRNGLLRMTEDTAEYQIINHLLDFAQNERVHIKKDD